MAKSIYKQKNYKHIDKPFDVKNIENDIENPNWIIHHNFYPFISYEIKFKKYSKEIDEDTHHHWKIKERPIKYAAHIDRYIYQWYAYILNTKYNVYCNENGINNVAIAYRTCLKGMTNIEFTKIAYDFIKKCKSCYILVSDFSKFFDYIEHDKLKKKICEILNTNKLDEDVYKVYKSMIKYSYIERNDIENYLITNKIETEKSIRNNSSLFENIKWSEAKKILKTSIVRNNEEYGIPQGSPLSGIFANIYMIDFDKKINNYVSSKKGMYMRYSDDLIIIIPKEEINSAEEIWEEVQKVKNEYSYLKMNKEKSSMYLYNEFKVISLHDSIKGLKESSNSIDFLGFTFDGKYIKFRDKTLTKFYYKIYRKIDAMLRREQERIEKGKKRKSKIDKKRILKSLRSSNGETRKFIDYVNRAKKVYKHEKYIQEFRDKAIEKIFIRFQ